jgi:hypothetical protein
MWVSVMTAFKQVVGRTSYIYRSAHIVIDHTQLAVLCMAQDAHLGLARHQSYVVASFRRLVSATVSLT